LLWIGRQLLLMGLSMSSVVIVVNSKHETLETM